MVSAICGCLWMSSLFTMRVARARSEQLKSEREEGESSPVQSPSFEANSLGFSAVTHLCRLETLKDVFHLAPLLHYPELSSQGSGLAHGPGRCPR